MPKFTRSRNYCFTDFEILDLNKIYNEYSDIIRYICWGEELAPTTKKVHLQGWIQFVNPKKIGRSKKIFSSNKIHLETCKGTEFDNDKYCKKDNKFVQLGKFIKQGHRSDLEKIQKMITKGASLKKIMDNHFETYCRYRNGIRDYYEEAQRDQRREFRKLEVEYVHGTTGTGKTRYAVSSKDHFKIMGTELNWFDRYNGEKTLVIDEYANDVKITKMLGLLDGYEYRLPIKGGFTFANWNKVIITSNLPPESLHTNALQAHREALFRRITKVIELK